MSVKANRSEIYVIHKSRRQNAQEWAGNKSETSFGTKLVLYRCTWTYIGREVHGGTLLNKLFSKVLELRDTYGIAANKLIGDVQFVIKNS